MKLTGHVDRCEPFCIHGWAMDEKAPARAVAVRIVVNGEGVGVVPAAVFRHDLADRGDGRKAFWFNPHRFLRPGANAVEVLHAETGQRLHGGRATIQAGAEGGVAAPAGAEQRARQRWREAREDDASLTWGARMTGDSFVDAVIRYVDFGPATAILEIGPGYGRLLATLLERELPFARYEGLDLSADRTEQLAERFPDPRVRFRCGDVARDPVGDGFDLAISSATFEHLFPDVRAAATRLREQLVPGGWLCADFIQQDPDMLVAQAWFEPPENGGAFIRVYARAELEELLAGCGLRVAGVESIVLGQDVGGHDVRRIFVAAQRT